MTRRFTWSGLISLGSGLLCASFLIGLPARAQVNAVRYGGKPPWGFEKPVHIRGKVHVGEVFEQALGRGLYFVLKPADTGWRARVTDGPAGQDGSEGNDLLDEATECHGEPGWNRIDSRNLHAGDTIHLYFSLTADAVKESLVEFLENRHCECASFPNDCFLPVRWETWNRLHNKNSATTGWRNGQVGPHRAVPAQPRVEVDHGGWGAFVVISIPSIGNDGDGFLEFEVDLSFTAGLKPWNLPTHYVIPKGYKGWVRLYVEEKAAPPLPKGMGFYVARIPRSGVLHTSSQLRDDGRGSKYFYSDGRVMRQPTWAPNQSDCSGKSTQRVFFVGTDKEYDLSLKNGSGGPRQAPCPNGSARFERTYRGICKESVDELEGGESDCFIIAKNSEAIDARICGTNQLFSDFNHGDDRDRHSFDGILGSIDVVGGKFEVAKNCQNEYFRPVNRRWGGGTVNDEAIEGTIHEEWPEWPGKTFTVVFKGKSAKTWR